MPNSKLIWTGRALILGLAGFALYYPYRLYLYYSHMAFSGDAAWQGIWMVDDTALIPFSWRLFYVSLYLPTVLATLVMIGAAIWLTALLVQGRFFEAATVRALFVVGLSACLAGTLSSLAIPFDAWLLTAWNTDLPRRPIQLVFDSGEIGNALTGMGMMLMAHVLRTAADKHRENSEIV